MIAATVPALARQTGASDWQSYDLPFRALNITSDGHSLWACGTDAGIAVSHDNGARWEVKHQVSGASLLLNIRFVDPRFGYAAGTGGLLLTTVDGGESWTSRPGLSETILQVSFADPWHGIVRTPNSLLFTLDAGAHWSPVSEGQNSGEIKQYPYTFSLVALDGSHMAVMLKQGEAQYEGQAFLSTQDAGKTWRVQTIPNVTLYNFLRVGDRYWAVGTEVIHKEQRGGGYGVPVALYSTDGETWSHSTNDLSMCRLHMCTVCTAEGCFSSNGTIIRVFAEKATSAAFPSNKELTPKWAATDSAICFVASRLQCAPLSASPQAPSVSDLPAPTAVAPGPLGAPIQQGARCIACEFDPLFIDEKANGPHTVKLTLAISKNGTVTSAEAQNAPTEEIKSRIEQQARQWVFEPYLKDGVAINIRLNTTVRINIIHPR